MKKLMKKRAGFTLVELLIVIIIIGILAGAMLLVAGSGTDKAEATKIVSDLRGLKAAALMYYADNPKAVPGDIKDTLEKFMDRKIEDRNYVFEEGSNTAEWWVGLVDANIKPDGAKSKLQAIAGEVGLYGAKTQSGDHYEEGDSGVYMRAR